MDRRRADARPRHAPPRRRRLLDRDGRLRARLDRQRRSCSRACRSGARRARACSPGRSTCPAYGLIALARLAAARGRRRVRRGAGQSSSYVLLNSAAQEEVPDHVLGRVLGLISLVAPRRARDRPDLRRAALRCRSRRSESSAAQRSRCRSSGPSPGGALATVAEQPQLEHARRVEAVDPQHRTGRRGGRAGGHQPDELRADHLRAARLRLARDPRDDLVQRRRLPVLDVHDTCTSPARGRSSPSARTPGKPPPCSRTTAAISRATSSRAAQVDVERDQRPARADDHAAGGRVEPRRPEVRRELAGVDARAAAPRARRAGRTPGRAPAAP